MVAWLLLFQLPTSSHIMFQRSITVILQRGLMQYIVAEILVVGHRFFELFCQIDHHVTEMYM